MISGWGVSLPVYYYQNPDELVEKMRSFQDKLNDSFNNDPILDKILKEAKVNKSEKNTYKISTVNDNCIMSNDERNRSKILKGVSDHDKLHIHIV